MYSCQDTSISLLCSIRQRVDNGVMGNLVEFGAFWFVNSRDVDKVWRTRTIISPYGASCRSRDVKFGRFDEMNITNSSKIASLRRGHYPVCS